MAFYPYPTDIPAKEVFDMVVRALKGDIDPKESSHAIWHVIGWGLSKWDVHTPPLTSTPPVLTHADALVVVEDIANHQITLIPWETLLPILVDLLLKILRRTVAPVPNIPPEASGA